MTLITIGLNHKISSIETREKFFLDTDERELLLTELKLEPQIVEAFVLSTCNRTEIYAVMSAPNVGLLFHRLCCVKKQSISATERNSFYTYYDQQAVEHFLSVTSGLDSLVIGEKEILGQVKAAIALARDKQILGRYLNILTNISLRTGKKARTETNINVGGSSVSWAAVETAKSILGTLENKSVLIIGAGKMSQLAANDFHRKGVGQLYVMNRTKEKGDELARKFGGESVGFWKIEQLLTMVDVCICSVSAPHFVIEKELIQNIMKSRTEKLILVDICMPRNIDPQITNVKNVRLVGLDELDNVLNDNVQQRQNAVDEVTGIIKKQSLEFYRKINTKFNEKTMLNDVVAVQIK